MRVIRHASETTEPSTAPPRWWRRRQHQAKARHSFLAPQTGSATGILVHSTKPYPWTAKRRRRAANRIARASRKANRR